MTQLLQSRPRQQLWAEFRFGIIGSLLSDPPQAGELRGRLNELSERQWVHPFSQEKIRLSYSTLERWYYQSKNQDKDPVGVLRRKIRQDAGSTFSISQDTKNWLQTQYREHPSWSVQLHYDHLKLALQKEPVLGMLPSYRSVTRYMRHVGNKKKPRARSPHSPGYQKAQARLEARETRSFEMEYVGGLFHLDFHHCSRQLTDENGVCRTPLGLGIVDDHSRLCCHLQWYWQEDTESLVHGFSQALLKRALPRALLTDNGSAMISGEFTEGLSRLGILHETTLAYSPQQNGKIESFWGVLEGRLMAMIEGKKHITLSELNGYTQAWIEMEYNKKIHSETNEAPLTRFLEHKNVLRPAPNPSDLKLAFRCDLKRRQRHSDGTVSIEAKRFEIPSHYRHLIDLTVRYAKWDLSEVHLVDPRTQNILCRLLPVNLIKNSDQKRKPINPHGAESIAAINPTEVSPLLKKYLEEYSASGLPPSFIPMNSTKEKINHDSK